MEDKLDNITDFLKEDKANWPQILERVKAYSQKYVSELDQRFTSIRNDQVAGENAVNWSPLPMDESGFSALDGLPDIGIGTAKALSRFEMELAPLLVASAGPRYLGYVTGGVTPAAMAGEWLTGLYDQNSQSVSGDGDVSAMVEVKTVRLLMDLLGLPDVFMGGFVTGATMSNFTCLATARQWWGKQGGRDIAIEGMSGEVPVFSGVPHSSCRKSLALLGIGSQCIRSVDLLFEREAMDLGDLEEKIKALSGRPFILISSAGTVNTVDYDDLLQIALLKDKYCFWWHVDAAFGGFAACSVEHKYLLNGWERADSITVDGHKWLNVPYDSGIFFIRKEHHVLQYESFRNNSAPYLGDQQVTELLERFNYLNFLPENSRRLRALPAWFTLMAYGRQGYAQIIEQSVRMARKLSAWIEDYPHLRLMAPTRLNNICFTLAEEGLQPRVFEWLQLLNSGQKVFMSPTVYEGRNGIRASFVNWRTQTADLEVIQLDIQRAFDQFEKRSGKAPV